MLNESFLKRMRDLLGDEYGAFIHSLTEEAPVRGARVNRIKSKDGALPPLEGFTARKIPYADGGYILEGDGQIGKSAAHHAGLIYMQDPGAMAALSAIYIDPSWRVADLCAAPGGKSGQIAERLGEGGFLLSNEYVPKRAKILVGNLERLGATRCAVTSLDTERLAEYYPSFFDLVVVDAPCSGEGMFRKSEEARAEWTPEAPRLCAERQREILRSAYGMLRPGGRLLYSTCTWSVEENAEIALWLLSEFPELRIIPVREELRLATSDGIPLGGHRELCQTRRCYPHVTEGEGQYVSLFKKSENAPNMTTKVSKSSESPPNKEETAAILAFFRDTLTEAPDAKIIKLGENLLVKMHDCPLPERGLFMGGVLLGEVRRGILHPSHQLFCALGGLFKRKIELSGDPMGLRKYLDGEEIEVGESGSGWCVVTYLGAPLGGGKISGGRMKNHYPKGLRNK